MEPQEIINKTEKPNSYECGKVGNRFKIYYSNVLELKTHLEDLEKAGLYNKE